MIDVGPITLWELFKTLCTGNELMEFNYIIFKVSGKTFRISKQISMRRSVLSQMKTSMKLRPGYRIIISGNGEAMLPSDCLILHISTYICLSYTGKGYSQKIGSLECRRYSEPECSSLVKPTQTRMVICRTHLRQFHGGI